jgi:creatinine amidohydrolase
MKSVQGFLLLMGLFFISTSGIIQGQDLPYHYGELTAPAYVEAVELAGGTAIIPAGILEKHGAHLPLSTDLILAREISSRAAQLEYTILYPEFYFGQIFEAKHQPGTIAYSSKLVWDILEETCEELHRNGITKIVLVNGHGGNNNLFAYFCQAQLEKQKEYAVFFFQPDDSEVDKQIEQLRTTDYGGHADEVETSMVYAIRPDLVHADVASSQSGRDQERLNLPYAYTGIWWYASFPNHYAGDGSSPNKEIGELNLNSRAEQLAKLIKALKGNDAVIELQNKFYKEAGNPLETAQ